MRAAAPLRARNPAAEPHSHRSARVNPTPRRLGAARVWTIERVGAISIQHDPAGHKLEPAGSSVYPGTAMCEDADSGIAVIAVFGKAVLCRESNEESPESQWLFGAVWGAQPQRTPRGKRSKADVIA